MKYLCLAYLDEKKLESIPENERETFQRECFSYDAILRKNGHFVRLKALQSARNAVTLRRQNGGISITDGPFAETKEQIGGLLLLEATDLKHAAELMSHHPGIRVGTFEIRPIDEESTTQANAAANS
ncbi:MAG: YciI family protein [Alphaproteobacteria bacterium]